MEAANSNGPHVEDVRRIEAVRSSGLLDALPEERYDRLTKLASKLTSSPIALITLVDSERQFIKSQQGLAEPLVTTRQTPLSHSFCRHVIDSKQAMAVTDAREHELLRDNPAVKEYGAIAYLGVPLKLNKDCVLGALCVVDSKPRTWTEEDMSNLHDIADFVLDEISIFKKDVAAAARKRGTRASDLLRELAEETQLGLWTWDIGRNRIVLDEMARLVFEAGSVQLSYENFIRFFCAEDRPGVHNILSRAGRSGFGSVVNMMGTIVGAETGKRKILEIKGRQPCHLQDAYISGALREIRLAV